MIVYSLFFYFFSGLMLVNALGVILVKNPVYAVLCLIFAFVNGACLFILAGAEFLALLIIMVYVGAVAVLFLFVVMMLDIDFTPVHRPFSRYLPFALLGIGVLSIEIILLIIYSPQLTHSLPPIVADIPIARGGGSNIASLGHVLYTKYFPYFQLAGLVLLVAMLGAIVLTLTQKRAVKRQKISEQNARDRRQTIQLRNIPPRTGVEEKIL